ncbi:MAG TPA: hypothetical protein VE890_11035 [Thermoguttaceae bacterium]|nr:hypothetical protein [Thermoguttaceae bacterium]
MLVGLAIDAGAAPPALPGTSAMPTMGGKQFWADELFFHQWRIQRNVLTGHCRLLDEQNYRHESGTFEQCYEELARIRREQRIPPMRGKAVIVLHGLFRSRASMEQLCASLRRNSDYTVLNVGYPSTRRDVAGHAHALARIIENLAGIEEINFVAHSMGNIVIRHYLADQTAMSPDGRVDPRFRRFVMLTPPNQGSLVATAMPENRVLESVTGEAVRQLGQEWDELEGKLATPSFEFGILAGGRGDESGYNPLLPGDDDGTVSVAHTRLAGAHDFAVLPLLHSSFVSSEKVMQYTLRFLQKGYFISATRRHPLNAE